MKRLSIKVRITLWYTAILSIVLLGIFISIYQVSRIYSMHDVKSELRDETADMCENLENWKEEHPQKDVTMAMLDKDWTSFYDDNVMLSLYNKNGEFLNGLRPERFEKEAPVREEISQWKQDEETWLVSDYLYDNTIWIRGVASYTSWTRILQKMLAIFGWLFPGLVVLTCWIGYRMLSEALSPIYTLSGMAGEIANSTDLSKRIPDSGINDEFQFLITEFNKMLGVLEISFQTEKQFSSDAAHELRTPLSVILGHCEYLLEDVKLESECEQEIQIIYQKSLKMNKLVNQLLAITRSENRKMIMEEEEINLEFVIESVLEELEKKALGKNIKLQMESSLENPIIHADSTFLTRVIMNLAENGITYGKENGHLIIYLESYIDSQQSGEEKSDESGKGKIQIRVVDDGIGMKTDELSKIWNRFYRADSSRSEQEGFGLGLYMVKCMIEQYGGKVTVTSTLGEGSCFTIVL